MNRNKEKGDRAERAVRDYLANLFPGAFKTRAGFNDDLGDVVVPTAQGLLCVQVKDVAQPRWKEWFQQLSEQVDTLTRESGKPVVGGVIVWKLRGSADPAQWRAVMQLKDYAGLFAPTEQQ